MSHKGQIPLIARLHSARRQLSPPWPPSRPGSAQEIVLPSFKKEKQAQKNKPVKHEKNKSVFVFFVLPSDGKLTIKFTCP